MNAVDTNVLIYSIDAADLEKQRRALALIESLPEHETVMPWQVACEVGAVLRSMGSRGKFRGDVAEAVAALRGCFRIVLPSVAVLESASRLEQDHQVSTWDALLIAACSEAGVTRLYSEDMQSGPTLLGVTVVSPFA